MENLIFSLNATVPIFLLMILGLLFHKIGWIDDVFAQKMNKFVFVVPLPVLVFSDLATVDFHEVWNMKFVLFCFLATFLSITLVSFMSLGLKERALRGEFIQASYRSSAALLGIAFIQNIYGKKATCKVRIITKKRKPKPKKTSGTVYWTPSGQVYHSTRSCPTLSRSRVVKSGSLASCPKKRPCKVCH